MLELNGKSYSAKLLGAGFSSPHEENNNTAAKKLPNTLIYLKSKDRYFQLNGGPKSFQITLHKPNKIQAIEACDRGIGAAIDPLKDDPDVVIVVTADHSTPSGGMLIHSGEPLPLLIHGTGLRRDDVNCFDEIAVASGALSLVRGRELLYLILNYLDRAKLQGLMDTPDDQPYWPGDFQPFADEP